MATLIQEIMEQSNLMERSFFVMADASAIEKMDLEAAKKYLLGKVEDQPKAKPENVQKANKMINSAKSIGNLIHGVSNFILGSEGLQTIKT